MAAKFQDGGSVDAPRYNQTQDDDTLHVLHEDEVDAEESSALLGAGAQDDPNTVARKGGWVGFEDFEGLPWWRIPSVWWLLGPYFLFTLAFGGSLVPKLNLIIDLICDKYFFDRASVDPGFTFLPVLMGGDNPQCLVPEVQKIVAIFTLLLQLIPGALSAIVAPRLGALSDRYGRKRLMVISSCGGVMNELIIIFAAKFPEVIHYKWLLLGAVFDGIAGSFTAGSVLGHSYVSDCTPPSKRGVAIGYLHACLFTGLAFGPLIAGYFVKWTGSLLSIFYITLGCHVFFILFILFVLPESLSKKRQMMAREKFAQEEEYRFHGEGSHPASPPAMFIEEHRWMRGLVAFLRMANPFGPLKILAPTGPGTARLRRNLIALAGIDMIIIGAAMGAGTVTMLYAEYIFEWGTFETSKFVSAVSLVRVFVLMVIFPAINYVIRTLPARRQLRETGEVAVERNAGADEMDIWVLRVAIVSDIVGEVGYIFARTEGLFVASAIITAFGGLGSATIQSAMTKHVSSEQVGQLLGAIGMLQAIGRVIAPVVFNSLYAVTVDNFPQAIFVLLSSLFGAALAAACIVRPHVHAIEETQHEEGSPEANQGSPDDDTLRDEGITGI